MTVDEMHSMLERFKSLFEDSKLAWYIKLAGIGGIAGIILVVIELGRVAVELYRHVTSDRAARLSERFVFVHRKIRFRVPKGKSSRTQATAERRPESLRT